MSVLLYLLQFFKSHKISKFLVYVISLHREGNFDVSKAKGELTGVIVSPDESKVYVTRNVM
jgi:hypothetical protein